MKILEQGCVIVQKEDLVIQTVLGSCVSVAAVCTKTGCNGMNHFALPYQGLSAAMPERYGIHAMEYMLNSLYKMGADKSSLNLLYTGGASLKESNSKVGLQNIGFVEDYCQTECLNIVFRDVGGVFGREVLFYPSESVFKMKRLNVCGEGVDLMSASGLNRTEIF